MYRLSGLVKRYAVTLTAFFLLPVLLIHAQPDDSGTIKAFLALPEGCPAPCFMGIRPGETTLSELGTILNHQAWIVPGSAYNPEFLGGSLYTWRWTETAPSWIEHTAESAVLVSGQQVTSIVIETTIPWGKLLLSLGRPDRYRLRVKEAGRSGFPDALAQGLSWYADSQMEVITAGVCWRDSNNMYEWPVRLRFDANSYDMADIEVLSGPLQVGCK